MTKASRDWKRPRANQGRSGPSMATELAALRERNAGLLRKIEELLIERSALVAEVQHARNMRQRLAQLTRGTVQ